MALPKGGMLVLSVEFDVLANNPMTQATAAERKSPLLLMPVLQVAQQNHNSWQLGNKIGQQFTLAILISHDFHNV